MIKVIKNRKVTKIKFKMHLRFLITPVTWMLSALTLLDHMYVNVSLVILVLDQTAQVNLVSSLQYLDRLQRRTIQPRCKAIR